MPFFVPYDAVKTPSSVKSQTWIFSLNGGLHRTQAFKYMHKELSTGSF